MKNINRGTCCVCGEPIHIEDPYYEMPNGDLVCENCDFEWLMQYHHWGEDERSFYD